MKTLSLPPQIAASQFQFTRLVNGQPLLQDSLAAAMGDSDLTGHVWLFVSPHDDDLAIGAGLLMQAAGQAGVDVQCLIVTDGCLGYWGQPPYVNHGGPGPIHQIRQRRGRATGGQ